MSATTEPWTRSMAFRAAKAFAETRGQNLVAAGQLQGGSTAYAFVTEDGSEVYRALPPGADINKITITNQVLLFWQDLGYQVALTPKVAEPFVTPAGVVAVLPFRPNLTTPTMETALSQAKAFHSLPLPDGISFETWPWTMHASVGYRVARYLGFGVEAPANFNVTLVRNAWAKCIRDRWVAYTEVFNSRLKEYVAEFPKEVGPTHGDVGPHNLVGNSSEVNGVLCDTEESGIGLVKYDYVCLVRGVREGRFTRVEAAAMARSVGQDLSQLESSAMVQWLAGVPDMDSSAVGHAAYLAASLPDRTLEEQALFVQLMRRLEESAN